MERLGIPKAGRSSNTVSELVERLRTRDASALARAITLVELRTAERIPVLKALFPFTGRARVIGITGAPGSGKSTLVGQMIREYRGRQETVSVIAIDPTSPYSGGATLGDRIRMQSRAADSGIFIRSMASRGQLGGLAPATDDVAVVLDASGFDYVLIETVGAGQDQLDILSIADILAVLVVPGMGDDIQVAKAGILEAADIFVINKSDRDDVAQIERALQESLFLSHRRNPWTPPIVRTVAATGAGVPGLVSAVDAYFQFLQQHELVRQKAAEKWQARLLRMVCEWLVEHLLDSDSGPAFRAYAAAVAERRMDPYSVVDRLMGADFERPTGQEALTETPVSRPT